jgi:hypothetical protein
MAARRSILTTLLAVVLIAGLTGYLPAAEAAKKKKKRVERTAEAQYVGFSGFRGAVEGACDAPPVGCVILPVEKGERFVSVEVADSAGQPVWASVYTYGYSDPSTTHEHVCGASEEALAIAPGVTELVVVLTQTTGGATSPCVGPATVGTVAATFSNLP